MGMIILIIFVIYILVGFFLSKLVYKIFQKKLISRLFLAFFIVFPFWDILLQNAIAITYSTFNERTIIYSKAELDKDGKVHSIANLSGSGNIKNYTTESFDKYDTKNFSLVSSHLEFLVKDTDGKKKILKVKKLAQGKYDISFIEKSEARYKIIWENHFDTFFGGLSYEKIIDTNDNKLMAKSANLYFKKQSDYIRTNILYMVGGTGVSIFKRPNVYALPTHRLLNKIGIDYE